jgi:hypothetical protein
MADDADKLEPPTGLRMDPCGPTRFRGAGPSARARGGRRPDRQVRVRRIRTSADRSAILPGKNKGG